MDRAFDVIVVGGGLSGLAACQRLAVAGWSVALVEARPRLGGRVLTRHDGTRAGPIELGPEWFDPHGPVDLLLQGGNRRVIAAKGRHLRRTAGELVNIEEVADGGEALHRMLRRPRARDESVASALARCCRNVRYAEPAAMLRHYIEGFHAADPDHLSLAWWNAVEQNEPASAAQLRTRDGLDQLITRLTVPVSPMVTAFLQTELRSVRWKRRAVVVDCHHQGVSVTLKARAVVLTLPLSIWQIPVGLPGSVHFTPELAGRVRPLDRMAMGPVAKVNLVFDEPFWEALPGLGKLLFLQDFTQPIPTWWTMSPRHAPILVGWAAGPQVARLGAATPSNMRQVALASLAHVLRLPGRSIAKRLLGFHWHDWQRDPFSRGAYSWIRTGGIDAPSHLATPIRDTLFFAGEATCSEGRNATMDGAIASGWRAADEVLALG